MKTDSTYARAERAATDIPQTVAVIDIGATSLRMQIAEIRSDGSVRKLEEFTQAVSIGKDSFIKGRIEKRTIEDCVHVLQIYRAKINEYGISDANQIRVVGTSGVKEAANQLAFKDRVFVATGFEIEPFDEAELHRVTYLGILPFMESHPEYFDGQSVVCEVGGGTTEILVFNGQDVTFSQNLRLGSLRLRKTLEAYEAPPAKSRQIMESQIQQTITQLKDRISIQKPSCLIAMGGDIRFAAGELCEEGLRSGLVPIELDSLEQFTDKILSESPDRLVGRYHLSLPDAESLGPGLLTHLLFARALEVEKFCVAKVNLRDGLITEIAQGRKWSESIVNQIERSAMQIGRKFRFNQFHSTQVADLAIALFDQLRDLHQLNARFHGILKLGALMHEIGLFIGARSYHKHSMYLIRNSEFFGINAQELLMVSLIARYHRGRVPQPTHEGYADLDRDSRITVTKLAAILRVAKALDAARSKRIKEIQCHIEGNKVVVTTPNVVDLSLEQLELRQSGSLFEDIFGKRVILRAAPNE